VSGEEVGWELHAEVEQGATADPRERMQRRGGEGVDLLLERFLSRAGLGEVSVGAGMKWCTRGRVEPAAIGEAV